MTLTIELKPELEAQLAEEAKKTGLDTTAYVVNALEERLHRHDRQVAPHLSERESALLLQINQGLSEVTWVEYQELIAKRRAETLTHEEHNRLIELSGHIESAHVARLSCVAELAAIRCVSLDELIQKLGITPREV